MLRRIRETIEHNARPVGTEKVPLLDALGRVAARTIKAREDAPRVDISALDGYAVRGGGPRFRLVGELEPARSPRILIRNHEAVFVPTGASIPRGTRFLPREQVVENGSAIEAHGTADARKTWKRGLWLPKGAMLVERGARITPPAVERLAMAGYAAVAVFRRVRVAVLATGNELASASSHDSNRYFLAALAKRDGAELCGVTVAPDDVHEIARTIEGLSSADLLIITGGTARGKKDVTRAALRAAGARFLLQDLPLSPGKTMVHAKIRRQSVFLLPGNPRPLLALYTVFVRPCLFHLSGETARALTRHSVVMPHPVDVLPGTVAIVPVLIADHQPAVTAVTAETPDGFVVLEGRKRRSGKGELMEVAWPGVLP